MTEDINRVLATDREIAVMSDDADVSDNYRYQVRSKVRDRIDRLAYELDELTEAAPDLARESRDAVCDTEQVQEADRVEELEARLQLLENRFEAYETDPQIEGSGGGDE